MDPAIRRIAILAVGLIGGSLAKGLKARGFNGEIVGWGRRETSLERALALGVIDRFSTDLAIAVKDADVVVIATPTQIAEQMLAQVVPLVPTTTVITDVASVKGNLLAAAQQAFAVVPPNLVLAHPIAGSEQSGVEAARADLYINHRVILTPVAQTDAGLLDRVRGMWNAVGAEVVTMSVEDHDTVLAATSHLPHLLAYALVDALAGQQQHPDIFRFAAGGFRDFTRIASSDPTMWQEICLANRAAILAMLDVFDGQLQQLRAAIDHSDGDAVMACFERAKKARDTFTALLARQNGATITHE